MIYLLHGPDEFSLTETVASMQARMAEEDASAELNTASLDGGKLTVGALEESASTLPFLGERRLVIVSGMLARCNPRGGEAGGKELAAAMKAYLPRVPETTRLVFVEPDIHANNPVRKWIEAAAQDRDDVVVRAFEAPKAARLPAWLDSRADALGGAIERDAAVSLAEALSQDGAVDLRLAQGELEKLLLYARDRAVTAADVALLVTPVSMERIFAFTDALADRDSGHALTVLHRFLATGEPPLRLMALLARQVRLLTVTRAMLDEGAPDAELKAALPVPPFVARKLKRQATRFAPGALKKALLDLAELDTSIKTGGIEPILALDLFVARFCERSASASS